VGGSGSIMELFHRRLAELWWKYRLGQRLTLIDLNEWLESLDALTVHPNKKHWFEWTIARLHVYNKLIGSIPRPLLSEWEKALDANLEYCWKVHKLEEMARLAEEIGERSWAHRLQDELGRIKEGVTP